MGQSVLERRENLIVIYQSVTYMLSARRLITDQGPTLCCSIVTGSYIWFQNMARAD